MLIYGLAEQKFNGGLLLDIGSKDGGITKLISDKFDVIAADLAFKSERSKKDYINYVYSDGRQLAFKDNTFDIVTANQVLEHVYEKTIFIREVYRVLKPGGVFLVSFPNRLFPLDFHGFPLGTPWLPKSVGLRLFKAIKEDKVKYYESNLHYISSISARNMLNKYFGTVFFVSTNAIVESGHKILGETLKGELILRYRTLLSFVSKKSFLEKLVELTFPHTAYWCQKDS